jgi:hypothetical protein
MVRTISSTLTTAIGAKTRRPAITLTAEDHINHLNNAISTAGNVDSWYDMCVANDGSIIRVRVTRGLAGTEFVQSFQWQRISDPTNASQWTTWTTFSGASGNMSIFGGCCVSNNTGTLRAFAQDSTGASWINNWWSFDNGQTWNGPAGVVALPSAAIIKGIGSAGHDDVFFLYDVLGGEALGACFYTGTWSALVSANGIIPLLFDGNGIAVVYASGSYTLVYNDPYAVYLATYTPGSNTWTFLDTLAPTTTTAIGRLSPHISLIDGVYYLAYVESDGGTYTGTIYSYPRVRMSKDLVNWSTGFILHDMPSFFCCNLVKTTPPGASRALLVATTPKKVEYANAYSQGDTQQYLDLSPYILAYKREEEIGKPSKLTVLLDNSGGALNAFVAEYGVTSKPIGMNTSLILSEGYYTGNPPPTKEVVQVGKYRIKQTAFERAPGKSHLQIIAEDISSFLDYKNRYQATYTNVSIQTAIQKVVTLAGILAPNILTLTQLCSACRTSIPPCP